MSKIKVNEIVNRNGSSITIGDANTSTVAINSGTTLTGFTSTGIDDNATSTAITIDSSENVGIGETVPLGKLHVKSADSGVSSVSGGANEFVIEGSGDTGMCIVGGTSSSAQILFGDSGSSFRGAINYDNGSDSLIISTSGSERMLIQSNGDIFFKNTTESAINGGSTDGKFIDNADGCRLRSSRASTSTREHIIFYNPNGDVGDISTSGTSTSYNTSSDYRLKENVIDLADATTRVKQLQPKRFNFIADADTTVDGFLAHEVSSIVPEAITGTHNEVDEEGNPVYQGIDQSKLVPLLTASLKEAIAKIEELETRIAALENA